MSEQELALGQREISPEVGPFVPTEEEQKLLDDNNVSLSEVQSYVNSSGKQTLNDAIGGVVGKRSK